VSPSLWIAASAPSLWLSLPRPCFAPWHALLRA
jgi:hypothetical protein